MNIRKLSDYYKFNLEIKNFTMRDGVLGWYCIFLDTDNKLQDLSKEKLTPSQWMKAKQYLTRELVPFHGYTYKVKQEYQKEAIYKIR